jgi:hypothetical protein
MKLSLSYASRIAVDDDRGSSDVQDCPVPISPSTTPVKRGVTTIRLPLGGVASTEAGHTREPVIRPFWLLAAGLGMAIAIFVWLRVNIF